MIISKLMGGLGNQMFEYAAGYVAAKHSHTELKLDPLYLYDTSPRHHRFEYRPYSLELFKISATIATPKEISKFVVPRINNKYIYYLRNKLHRDKYVLHESDIPDYNTLIHLPRPANYYLDGFFQKYAYLENDMEDIRKEFMFKDALPASHQEIANKITHQNAVCVCFRRGDYVGHPTLDLVNLDYYYKGLQQLQSLEKELSLFVFSDDIPWCQEHFKPQNYTPYFVSPKYAGPLAGNYLQLMMLCKHFIIPNSTYHYWAALLSEHHPQKKVIAPSAWYKGQQGRSNILPKEWITL